MYSSVICLPEYAGDLNPRAKLVFPRVMDICTRGMITRSGSSGSIAAVFTVFPGSRQRSHTSMALSMSNPPAIQRYMLEGS